MFIAHAHSAASDAPRAQTVTFPRVDCRLEAQYGHQQEVDMIPLMMEKDYKPQGWRELNQRLFFVCYAVVISLTCAHFARSGPDHGHTNVVRDAFCASNQLHLC